MTNIDLSGDPSIYTATADDLRRTGNLEDSEIQSIQDAIAESQSSGVQVSELLDADLMIKIRSLPFSDESSGFYSIIIQPDTQNPRPFRRLSCSFEAADVSGPGDSIVRYMEWMFF